MSNREFSPPPSRFGVRAILAVSGWFLALGLLLAVGCSEDEGGGEIQSGILLTSANPSGGTYDSTYALSVTLSTNRPAVIYYSTDGRTPGEGMANTSEGESPVNGIPIVRDTVLKFYAVDQEGNQEAVRSEEYVIDNPPATSAVPAGDSYPGPITVVLFVSEDASTYFTLDGSTPQASQPYRYPAGSEIQISEEGWTTLKFFSVDERGNPEPVRTERYRIDLDAPGVSIEPGPGRYLDPVSVTLEADEVATIYYTLDGSTPSVEFSDWVDQGGSTYVVNTSTGLGLSEHTLIRYIAEDEVGNQSPLGEALYLVGTTPYTSASPRGGSYTSILEIELSVQTYADAAADIYYTTDNTSPDPDDPGDVYLPGSKIPVVEEGVTVIRFLAIDENGFEEERFEVYRIDTIPPSTTASPPGDVYYRPQQVTLNSGEEATLYYSINGEDPEPGAANTFEAPSPITNIVVSTDLVLKFMGVDAMGNSEPVQTEVYHVYYRVAEDFSDEEAKDPEATTADWDTGGEVLALERGEVPLLGSYDTDGESAGLVPVDEFAYLAEGDKGIRVFDVSYPEDLLLVSSVARTGLSSAPVALARSGMYLFAGGSGGITVIDVSDPIAPDIVAGLGHDPLGAGRSLEVYGDYIYVADGAVGLETVNITNPLIPQLTGTTATPGDCQDVIAAGNYLYIADSASGLVVYDIADPAAVPLVPLNTRTVTGQALSLARDGNLILVGAQEGAITLMGVTNPESPSLRSTLNACTQPVSSITVRGTLAYLACGSEGLVIVNISDPDSPQVERTYADFGNLQRITSSGTRLLASDGNGGIKAMRASSLLGNPPLLGSLALTEARGITLYRRRAYVANGADGIVAVDISDPAFPALTSEADTVQARMSRIYGNHLVLADGPGGIKIFSLGIPDTLGSPVGEIDTESARHLEIMGTRIVLADGPGGVKIFELGDPSTLPSGAIAHVDLSDARGVAVHGDHLYVADADSGLVVLDISDPAAPDPEATVAVSGVAQMPVIRGNHLYLAAGSAGLLLFDISDPGSPVFVEGLDLLGDVQVKDAVVEGNHLFLVSDRGVEVVNVDFPRQPVYLRTVSASGTQGVAFRGDYGYAVSGSAGVTVLQMSRESPDYISPGYAGSLTVDSVESHITRAEVRPSFRSESYGDVTFSLSNNGGQTWEEFEAYRLQPFTTIGSDLRWRATLSTPDPTRSPVIDELVILYKIAR